MIMKRMTGLNTLTSGIVSKDQALDRTEHHTIAADRFPIAAMKSGLRARHLVALLSVPTALLLVGTLNAQKPRDTELYLDSVRADSVRCGGLTIQFARFFKDAGHTPLAGQKIEGSEKTAIDIWIWNRTDSARTYDPHVFKAVNDEGNQLAFWSADEVGDYVAGHHGLFESGKQEDRERAKNRSRSRREYQAGNILPGVSGGPRILVPDNDKHLDKGINLYCGDTKLGFLHKK